jgi:hypothetical protein
MSFAERLRPVPLIVFLLGTFLAAATRQDMEGLLAALPSDPPLVDRGAYEECFLCQRSTAWLYLPLRWALGALSELFFLGPDAGPFAVATPWGYPDAARSNALIVAFTAYVGYRVLLALPVYWLAVRLFPGTFARLAYILAVLAAMGGWPAALINVWFSFAGLFFDWPAAYYNFSQGMTHYDWTGIGFVHLLALVILRGATGPLAAFALAVFGQWAMDNLGLVTGIALGLAAWSTGGFRNGAKSLAAAGVGSVLMFTTIALLGDANWDRPGWELAAGESDWFVKVAIWWRYYWDTYAHYNFLWMNVLIANFISLMVWPTVAGLILGAGFAKSRGGAKAEAALRALAFPAIGFSFTLLIGLFKTGYASDMGRQAMPLVVLTIPLAATASEALRAAWLRRRNKIHRE